MEKRSGFSSGSNVSTGGSHGLAGSSGHGGLMDKLGMTGTTNVGQTERMVTGVGGALLALSGLRRGGLGGLVRLLAGGALVARASTGHCPMYESMGSNEQEQRFARQHGWQNAAVTRESVVVFRPREQLYAFWRDFSNLSKVMSHIERVDVLDSRRSRWLMSLPLGKELEWNSSVTEDRQNERIAWTSDDGADVRNAGWVEFRDAAGGRGTEVIVQIAYEPPGGELGGMLARLWPQSPGALLQKDLRDFKRSVENGQIELQGGQSRSGLGSGGLGDTTGSPTQRH